MTTAPGWYPDPSKSRRCASGTARNGRANARSARSAAVATVPVASPSRQRLRQAPRRVPDDADRMVPARRRRRRRPGDTPALGARHHGAGHARHCRADVGRRRGRDVARPPRGDRVDRMAEPRRVTLEGSTPRGDGHRRCCSSFLVFAKINAIATASSNASSADSGLGLFGDTPSMSYGPGLGLFVYGAGVAGIWIGAVRAWRKSRVRREHNRVNPLGDLQQKSEVGRFVPAHFRDVEGAVWWGVGISVLGWCPRARGPPSDNEHEPARTSRERSRTTR